MTIPHLMNCSHSEDGWCLECVKKLQSQNDDMKDALKHIAMLATQSIDTKFAGVILGNIEQAARNCLNQQERKS